jgi:DNA primase
MITEKSIQEVREHADLLEVCKDHIPDLKKKGANYQACCPFHGEKSPSFTISPVKNIWKCYGCGAGGNDAIGFVMKIDRITFPEAVRALAVKFNIALQETEEDPDQAEKKTKLAEYFSINNLALQLYQKNLMGLADDHPARLELFDHRQLTMDSVIEFKLGFAPDEWKFLSPALIEQGLYKPAVDLGLVATKNDSNYDIYRNRIIFPILDEKGAVCGFGGRKMEDGNKDNPKYINSRDSDVYRKEQILYGLYQASKAIREMGFAVVVEGYYDVISFHQKGAANTVAPCGTALTEQQAKLLKRFTNHVVLMGDGDKAGRGANYKAVNLLLRHGFKVDICNVPDGEDPDSLARGMVYEEEAPEELIEING